MASHIGARIRMWRKRRIMTQHVLAGLAGVSQAYVSQIEAGLRSVDKRSTLIAFAAALKVSVAELVGQPGDPTEPAKAQAAAAVPAIRVALVEVDAGVRQTTNRDADRLRADIEKAGRLRTASDYGTLAPLLPDLLRDAAREANPLYLTRVAYITSSCLRSIGYKDLAWHAADLALDAARRSESQPWVGIAHFGRLLALPPETAHATALLAETASVELQPFVADVAARQVYGMLHLSAAFQHAIARHPQDADAHLTEAETEAESLGEPIDGGYNEMGFGPTNVSLWRMAIANELGDPGQTLRIARNVTWDRLPIASRQAAYWTDLARALVAVGGRDQESIVAFGRAERAAPQFFRALPAAQTAVSTMINRAKRRSVADDLHRLAERMGIRAT